MDMAVKLEDETKIKASLKQEGMQERPLCGFFGITGSKNSCCPESSGDNLNKQLGIKNCTNGAMKHTNVPARQTDWLQR
jgi:hypothetical protein